MAGVYNRASFREAKREALAPWYEIVSVIMTPEKCTSIMAIIKSATHKNPEELPIDPGVKLPADIQATIAQGEAAFKNQKKRRRSKRDSAPKGSDARRPFVTAVTDQEVQDRREYILKGKRQQSQGRRGQPPMLERLRVGSIIVDRLRAEGVPFGTGPNSRMNKRVREMLNEMASKSRDSRKSRRKKISADAVQDMLRQIKDLDH